MELRDAMDMNGVPSGCIRFFDDAHRTFFARRERHQQLRQSTGEFSSEQFEGKPVRRIVGVVHVGEIRRFAVPVREKDQRTGWGSLRR